MRGLVVIVLVFLMGFISPVERAVPAIETAPKPKELVINDTVTKIIINKTQRKLYAFYGDTFKWYYCAFGANPVGHKQREGDNKTPEGNYYISLKNPQSRGFRSLKISYPNAQDRAKARKMGVSPGGDIFIHGLWWPDQNPETHWMYDWTWGCVALNNQQIAELFKWTIVKTPVTISP